MTKQLSEMIEGRPLVHAAPGDNVRDVAKKMSGANVGAVAVLDSGHLVGIFSERDVLTRVVAEGRDPMATPVGLVMSKELVVAKPEEGIDDAIRKMHECNCRHLPVVRDGHLVGMISIRDLLQVDDETNKEKATFLKELVTYSPDYDS